MMQSNKHSICFLVAALVASADAFAPRTLSKNRLASSTSFPHRYVTNSDTLPQQVIRPPQVLQIPSVPSFSPSCSSVSCSTESLDAEMDTFADPNDRRYSASDWFHNMRSLPNSAILKEIKNPVGWITAWSTLVSIVYRTCNALGKGELANRMCLGSTPHSLIASSIGLLLVFRTNSAYQKFSVSYPVTYRYLSCCGDRRNIIFSLFAMLFLLHSQEGRKTWEKLLNTCRDITRMISVYEQNVGTGRKQRIQRLLAAFPYLLHHHIQPRCLDHSQCEDLKGSPHALVLHEPRPIKIGQNRGNLSTERECWVDKRSLPWCLLPDSVLNKCAQSHNRPLWVSDRLSLEFTQILYTDNFTSRERLELLKHANKLSECVGNCERIHQTAVPLNYARHALRSLTLWSFTLPFGIVDKLGLLTGPVVGMVAWLMFGVYQIGHTIEDPFQGSLRLTDMCNSIYRDVMYGDRNQAGMRRESAFRKDGEKEEDWNSLGDAFGLGWTVQAQKKLEIYNEQLVLADSEAYGALQ